MGTGFPRLHRQLASAAAVIAIWLALAPHAHADLLPATPVAPVAASTAGTVAASVTDVTNIVATPPAAELARAAPVIVRVAKLQVAKVSPALRPVVAPAVQRISAVIAPVVAVVRSVSIPPAAVAPTTRPAVRVVPAARPKHATAPRAARITGTAVKRAATLVQTPASPHPFGRGLAVFSGLSSPTHVARTPWRTLVFGPDTGPTGSAAASGGGAAASSAAALRPVSWLFGPMALLRFAAPNQVPRSTTLLLQLERPG